MGDIHHLEEQTVDHDHVPHCGLAPGHRLGVAVSKVWEIQPMMEFIHPLWPSSHTPHLIAYTPTCATMTIAAVIEKVKMTLCPKLRAESEVACCRPASW